jgi:hypothetical protein
LVEVVHKLTKNEKPTARKSTFGFFPPHKPTLKKPKELSLPHHHPHGNILFLSLTKIACNRIKK